MQLTKQAASRAKRFSPSLPNKHPSSTWLYTVPVPDFPSSWRPAETQALVEMPPSIEWFARCCSWCINSSQPSNGKPVSTRGRTSTALNREVQHRVGKAHLQINPSRYVAAEATDWIPGLRSLDLSFLLSLPLSIPV